MWMKLWVCVDLEDRPKQFFDSGAISKVFATIRASERFSSMDTPPLKPPSEMTDKELLREWECIDCSSEEEDERTTALAAELERRQLDV
jgi:hypothetical protein